MNDVAASLSFYEYKLCDDRHEGRKARMLVTQIDLRKRKKSKTSTRDDIRTDVQRQKVKQYLTSYDIYTVELPLLTRQTSAKKRDLKT